MKKFARKDSITGKGMNKGYCFNDGEKYFANEKDLIKEIRSGGDENFNNCSDEFLLNESYNSGEYYWTEWEIEEGENYFDEHGNEYDENGKLIN